MFWNPRFVSPIAIRFSFGRGLRDATRRGTWSRLGSVARDVRAPGRSQSGPVRACLLPWATGYLLPMLSGLPDSAALISSLVAQCRGVTRLPKSMLCGLPVSSVDLVVRGTPRGHAVPEIDAVRVARLESVDFVVRPGARLCAGFVGAGRHGVGSRPADCGGGEGDRSDECEASLREHCRSPFVQPRWLGRSKATCVPALPVEGRSGT